MSTRTTRRLIGYWFSSRDWRLPRPQRLVDPDWSRNERAAVAKYLRTGAVVTGYRGHSFCRFECGIDVADMGADDLGDDDWIWPEGLAHYVEAHHVRLPDEFVAHALARPKRRGVHTASPQDHEWWLEWATTRGACIRVDAGWSTLGGQDLSSIYHQLAAAGVSKPAVLARRRDGDAILCADFRVFSLRTGKLIADANDADEASLDRVAGVPELATPTEAELRAWAAEMVARPPRELEVETIVVWVPDGLAGVVEQGLAPGRFVLLACQGGSGGEWQRFYREP